MGKGTQNVKLDDILTLIARGEDERLEFKLDTVRNERLAKELGALANFRGGTLLLGVKDKGEIVGVTRDDNEERIQSIAYNFEPPLQLKIEKQIIENQPVLVVNIAESSGKPYVYKSSTRNIYYTRSGSVSREATRSEVRRMFQASSELHFEITPVSGTKESDLDFFLLNSFLQDYRNIALDSLSKEEQFSLLENLSLLTEDHKATVLGTVLFGKNPAQYLPGVQTQVVVYHNSNQQGTIQDHKIFSKALIAELPMIIAYLNNHNPHAFGDSKGQRQEQAKYPDFAVREAVVNALCHRDYTLQGAGVKIEVFPDRLIITSPGGVPNTQTVERMKAGISYARNPLLLQFLYDYRYVERLGRGIPRILSAMEANGNPPPELIDGETYFQLVLAAGTQ
jgi:ATP-dependent DNA helicase RecG